MKRHNINKFLALLLTFLIIISASITFVSAAAPKTLVWDGKTYTEPTVSNGMISINSPNELAWLLKNQNSKGATKVEINKNIDMAGKTFKGFPSSVITFDGNKKTISNIKISSSSMFQATTSVNIYDITLDNVSISVSKGNAGLLVGTVKDKGTFKNCHITNSSVSTSNGYAGGMVGYISRTTTTDRSTKLSVTFKSCSIANTKVNGTKAEGKYVGALSGYDKNEALSFTTCTAESVSLDLVSPYIAKNQSVFLDRTDASYDGFLGTEVYRRGTVKYNGVRIVPKWDGKTSVTPLLADPTYDGSVEAGTTRYAIYSPYDLAGARAKTASPNALYFKIDVDMNGQGADGKYNVPSVFVKSKCTSTDDNNFKPFSTVKLLDGGKKIIYNLSIYQPEKTTGAFILSASGTTVHKNINFNNCCTVSTHKNVSKDAKAYGAILISNAGGDSYTMTNVKAVNCKVFALQKIGTLAGRLGATKNTVKSCAVENCYIENYKCSIPETFSSGNITFEGRTVKVTASFYPQGEVGGMFGFVQNTATISNCSVKNTKIYAHGQNDKMATVTGSKLGRLAIAAAGYYKVPGRHVSTFIGDIRTTKTVKITNCTVDAASKCTNRWDHHNSTYGHIGQAYYVKFLDSAAGKVYVDGVKLVLADCNQYTSR